MGLSKKGAAALALLAIAVVIAALNLAAGQSDAMRAVNVAVQLLIVIGALYVGSRYGSLALGAISGIGLALLVLVYGLKPGNPPTDVIYIIIAAVTCAGLLQASGGMDWLIQLAERLIRGHPNHITFLAPLCTFFLTVLCGTGHVVYTLMPIICDISLKKGIRPERPCAVASIASQVGITCSPISAAVVAFTTISAANGFNITIPNVVMVTIPSCLCGILAAAAASYRRGVEERHDGGYRHLRHRVAVRHVFQHLPALRDGVAGRRYRGAQVDHRAGVFRGVSAD